MKPAILQVVKCSFLLQTLTLEKDFFFEIKEHLVLQCCKNAKIAVMKLSLVSDN